ncbi:hypothetical protein Nhal_3680 [Nitrosococcus halophilus Nc 4]|uniref:Uncharacterized protein n=1 Tax=Nitrosococcus halophilus (strain Nc4) TaxID=472759 RepID=D5C2M5_NITHN|nr:hypothetical protein Nhal_3680 [Nitrosococcus halophilus Nc 4]
MFSGRTRRAYFYSWRQAPSRYGPSLFSLEASKRLKFYPIIAVLVFDFYSGVDKNDIEFRIRGIACL